MEYLRRNLPPILVGIAAFLVSIAAVVVIVDTVLDDDDDDDDGRRASASQRLDEDQLSAIEGLLGLALGDLNLRGGSVLGVTVEEIDGAVMVRRVLPGTPADHAGVEVDDVIVSVGGEDVATVDGLRAALDDVERGEEYELELRRGGRALTLDVERPTLAADIEALTEALTEVLTEALHDRSARAPQLSPPRDEPPGRAPQPQPPAGARLGVTVADADDGVRVTSVLPGSGADEAGLRRGDVITRLGEHRVGSIDDLRDQLAGFAPGDVVTMSVRRGDAREELRVRLGGEEPPSTRAEQFRDRIFPRLEPDGQEREQFERFRELLPGILRQAAASNEQLLGRLADQVAERLERRRADADVERATDRPNDRTDRTEPEGELRVFLGRVAEIGDGSITLSGELGSVTLRLTDDMAVVGRVEPAVGRLVTVVARGGVVEALIVIS